MLYRTGDYVCPADLPRRFVCRITQAERIDVGATDSQILKLRPLEGPWPPRTVLIRLDTGVLPADREEVPGARGRTRGATFRRPDLQHVHEPSRQRAIG